QRALQFEPDRRFRDCREFAVALQDEPAPRAAAPSASKKASASAQPAEKAQATEFDLAVGSRVGEYVVEAEIGRGGRADVYRVRHARFDGHFALKVLAPWLQTIPDANRRFIAEGQIQSRKLDHPNIVKVFGTVGDFGLVMEFVDGPTLARHIYTKGIRRWG